jgi:hypothetical protein
MNAVSLSAHAFVNFGVLGFGILWGKKYPKVPHFTLSPPVSSRRLRAVPACIPGSHSIVKEQRLLDQPWIVVGSRRSAFFLARLRPVCFSVSVRKTSIARLILMSTKILRDL